MPKLHRLLIAGVAVFLLPALSLRGQSAPLLDILGPELNRNFEVLKQKTDMPAYYLSYAVTEVDSHVISGMLGSVSADRSGVRRVLDVSIRLGSPKLDNYHPMPRERARFTTGSLVSVDNNPEAIRRRLWLDTDRSYRLAAQRLIKIRASTQARVEADDASPDFSAGEEAAKLIAPPAKLELPVKEWSERIRRWSAALAGYPRILASGVNLTAQGETRYFADSEGAQIQQGRIRAQIAIMARAKAADGLDLVTSETISLTDPALPPKDELVMAAVERVAKDLMGLLNAPDVEPYVGPAILSGRAAGVFFHEIFGHRIEGHRQKDESEGQTFTKSVNSRVLPEFLSVIADPTLASHAGAALNGSYLFDDEGIKAQRVAVVESGILKTFLMSRSPVRGFPKSNGHGRRQPGYEAVSRQSNLIVTASETVSEEQLRRMLLEEVRKQAKPYGLYFREVSSGFTMTGRAGLQAFSVVPLVVYRVYPDGRPDELVRGVDIVGTPLASFAKILAASDRPEVFNGFCGAESGTVPVAAVSPALLVSEIEVQKKERGRDRPPLLSRPPFRGEQ